MSCVCYSITLHMIVRLEKYVSICSDSRAALKALQAAQNIPIGMAVPMGIEWHFHPPFSRTSGSPDILDYVEMILPVSLQRWVPFICLSDQSCPQGSRGQIHRTRQSVGFVNHHSTLWQCLTSTQRRTLELILSFNRMQPRVIGLLTGHKTMRKCLYILGLMASPWCRSCRP